MIEERLGDPVLNYHGPTPHARHFQLGAKTKKEEKKKARKWTDLLTSRTKPPKAGEKSFDT